MAPVEDATDRAGFFHADEWGVSATYTPVAGGAVAVTIARAQPIEEATLGGLGRVKAPADRIWLRRDEVASPERGATISIGAEDFVVKTFELDLSGEIYEVDLQPA